MSLRRGFVERSTKETKIKLELTLEGQGLFKGESGIGFFDHMLDSLVRHSGFDISLEAEGDLFVDDHHTVEDIGICLGKAFFQALGDKKGIARYASLALPMDESLVLCAVDISGRPGFYPELVFPTEKIGQFDCQLIEEFWRAFVQEARITLHLRQLAGKNSHHLAEAVFKGTGRILKEATRLVGEEIPSAKGVL
ncbi:imidazoleglycerol-phosphate dehydratase HisB [Thermanaerosceptrum fracticalcis]|uniref:Imidazoleglycerol-phosphate dehydratase n=1 Tax=Thermanaerosceptrum fracticalcis TaxID=1712410 RepID=A0A7G6E6H6_THEFR|nr:imidazoleglycerol-phosphate dehydratase HisB [Thermanaerosceptrum fracticalcis]QNB47680.1 imidazoleglycerol-phosphate dehydratase HisB [Thermanaerosceptrum fracticalcis]